MKYLVLTPEITAAPLRDEYDLPSRDWPISISEDEKCKIMDWNRRYFECLGAGTMGAKHALVAKRALDEEGELLAGNIAKRHSVKVKYVAG